MKPLLTPPQVAELLQLSLATIYSKAKVLGGFYPAGIKALRFNPEVLDAVMEGRKSLENPIPIRETPVQQNRIPHKEGRRAVAGGEVKGTGDDPAVTADAIRFGLRTPEP